MFIINFFTSLFKRKNSIIEKENNTINNKDDQSNENIYITDISESSDQVNNMVNEDKEKVDIKISTESYFDPIPEEMEPESEESESINLSFSLDEIAAIKDILRPIVKSYNYEKKDDFSHYAENVKIIKCFLTAAKDSELLIFRPTQSDSYNNDIALFVRRCILKDFKDGLVAAGIINLDIECIGGKIKIRKKI